MVLNCPLRCKSGLVRVGFRVDCRYAVPVAGINSAGEIRQRQIRKQCMQVLHYGFVVPLQSSHVSRKGSGGDSVAVLNPGGDHLLGCDSLIGQVIGQDRIPVLVVGGRSQFVWCCASLGSIYDHQSGILGRVVHGQRHELTHVVHCCGFSKHEHHILAG